MKRTLLLAAFIIGAVSLQAQELKVMSYNIWNGFDWGKSQVREEMFVEFMTEQDCDVAALQELCGFNGRKLSNVANRYGHPYSYILKSSGYPVGITSKEPIKLVKKKVPGFWHGFMHARTAGVDFIIVHLSPAESSFRRKEMKKISSYIRKNKLNEGELIILGDFNAHSPEDREVLDANTELLGKYSQANLRKGKFDYSVLQGFLDLGTTDILKALNPLISEEWTFPAEALVGDQENLITGERIDFQLTSPVMTDAAINGSIVVNELSRQISDHYPVVVEYLFQ